jgi:hypothetical protein
MDLSVRNVALITGASSLKARFDLDLVTNPAAEAEKAGTGTTRIYRCAFFRKDNGETFVGGPTFQRPIPEGAPEGTKAGYTKALSFAPADNLLIVAAVEKALQGALG